MDESMKAMEAPEKIYLRHNHKGDIGAGWLIFPLTNNDIEYTHTDAFIEKACEYISEHIEYYMKKDKMCNIPLCPLFATKSFIEDFKNYMKGE